MPEMRFVSSAGTTDDPQSATSVISRLSSKCDFLRASFSASFSLSAMTSAVGLEQTRKTSK